MYQTFLFMKDNKEVDQFCAPRQTAGLVLSFVFNFSKYNDNTQ